METCANENGIMQTVPLGFSVKCTPASSSEKVDFHLVMVLIIPERQRAFLLFRAVQDDSF